MTNTSRRSNWLTPKRLFTLHGWLGMNFGLLLVWVCLSGAIAALTHEIEWLADPALRIEPRPEVRWQETYDALRHAYPDHQIGGFSRGEPSVMDGLAWNCYVTPPDGSWAQVRVDPFAAEVVRPGTRLYLADFMRQLHYNFFSSNWGFYLVCFVAFPLLLSIVTALLFFKGWWKHLFKLRVRSGSRAFFSSLHRVTGVWSLIFGLIISVTGVWYLVERDLMLQDVVYPPAPKVSPEKMIERGPTPRLLPLERYIEAASEAFPGLEPTGIRLPNSPDGSVGVEGRPGRLFVRDRANAVYMDPYDASVIEIRDSSRDGAVSWWVNAADALHFGYWGGLTTKILWAFFGLCLPALVLSGAYLSWRRVGVIGGAKDSTDGPKPPWWRRYPIRTWILLPLMFMLIWTAIAGYERRSEAPVAFIDVGRTQVGPWRASVSREPSPGPDKQTRYRVAFDAGPSRVASFREAKLDVGSGDDASHQVVLNGPTRSMRASVAPPNRTPEGVALHLTVTGWNGQSYEASLLDTSQDRPASATPRYEPHAPTVFFGIVCGYAILSTVIAIAWFILDRKPIQRRAA